MSEPPVLPGYLAQHRAFLLDRITPARLLMPGAPHWAKNSALLGDRLLDLSLYEARGILDERSANTGESTILRSERASNRFLSRAGSLRVPALFEAPVWDGLTPDEQARVTEALVAHGRPPQVVGANDSPGLQPGAAPRTSSSLTLPRCQRPARG